MGDIVTFTLELNEKLSGGIQKAAVSTHSSFGGINDDISKTAKGLDDLGNERKIRVDHGSVGEATGAVEGLTGAMERLSEAHLIGGMALGELVSRGVEKTADFAKEQIKDVLSGGMEEGTLKLQMQVLGGDDAGEDLFEQIHNYIPKSLFGPELNHEAVVLLGMGETMKNILPDLKEFGDISMGDDQKLQSLILALGEAKAQGHLSGLEMRILRTTGFNPLVETARATGESMEHLTARMAEGKFSFDDLRKSMEYATTEGGRFNDMQERMLGTPGGMLKEMTTNIDQAKHQLGEALLPVEGELMKAFMPLVNDLPHILAKHEPALEGIIKDFTDLVHWTTTHTDTVKHWIEVGKDALEIYAAWKVATIAWGIAGAAASGLEMAWTASITGRTVATAANTTAIGAENVALGVQIGEVEALSAAYAGLGESETAALMMQKNFALTGTMAAGGVEGGMAALTGGSVLAAAGGVAAVIVLAAAAGWTLWKEHEETEKNNRDVAYQKELSHRESVALTDQINRNSVWSPVSHSGAIMPDESITDLVMNDPHNAVAAKQVAMVEEHKKKAASGGLASAADSIIGGGPRQIIINAHFGEKMVNHFTNVKEGAKQVSEIFKEEFAKVMVGLPGMQ